jgi:hypothetical protein
MARTTRIAIACIFPTVCLMAVVLSHACPMKAAVPTTVSTQVTFEEVVLPPQAANDAVLLPNDNDENQ